MKYCEHELIQVFRMNTTLLDAHCLDCSQTVYKLKAEYESANRMYKNYPVYFRRDKQYIKEMLEAKE